MPSTCNFLFDRPDLVYFSGDTLNGKIVLTTDKVKSVRAIYITIKGIARVKWTKNKHSRSKTNYENETIYINSRVRVVGEMDYPPGRHEYTFSTPLPPQTPSSILGKHGKITYEVELKLDRPLRIDDVYTSLFTVILPLDLNLDPRFRQPALRQEEKYLGCCCSQSGPIKSELRTEFSGYAPGQNIYFTLLIDNKADEDVEGCLVEFCQNMAFKSQWPSEKIKNKERVIGQIRVGGAKRYTKKSHTGSIPVPLLPPSTMNPADIIAVSYYLKAKYGTDCCSANDDLRTNIVIGTVPFHASAPNSNSVITVQPTAPSAGTPACDGGEKPPEYSSVVPPTFKEATEMDKLVDAGAIPTAPAGEQTPLIQQSHPQSWQSPQVVPGGPRPVVDQPETSQNNRLS